MHPYKSIAPHAHWRKAMEEVPMEQVDPVVDFKFRLTAEEKIATGGSCFAQHIARYLANSGYNYFVAEPGHPLASEKVRTKFGYGVYSARYGNIYSSRQLLQLFDRAYGTYQPVEDVWIDPKGRFADPFRPTVEPGGFASEAEMRADREQHLATVRTMFETLDVFVFTLGLTECWISSEDGACFPVCPGVSAGTFDPEKHHFVNLTVDDVVSDMTAFLTRLKSVNPNARVIVTVSPVPLMATAAPRHVLVSTTLSKAVLRAAADVIERRHENVAYFPSYEIITGGYNRGAYFGDDLRSVTDEGVAHVMGLFLRHATVGGGEIAAPVARKPTADEAFLARAKSITEVICDEELLR